MMVFHRMVLFDKLKASSNGQIAMLLRRREATLALAVLTLPICMQTVRLLMHTDHVSDAAINTLGIGDIQQCWVLVLLIHNSLSRIGNKKTDVTNHLEVIDRAGLLVNEPPAVAGCSSASHPNFGRPIYCVRRMLPVPSLRNSKNGLANDGS